MGETPSCWEIRPAHECRLGVNFFDGGRICYARIDDEDGGAFFAFARVSEYKDEISFVADALSVSFKGEFPVAILERFLIERRRYSPSDALLAISEWSDILMIRLPENLKSLILECGVVVSDFAADPQYGCGLYYFRVGDDLYFIELSGP